MKLYMCINERSLDGYAEHLRAAINSASNIGALEPHILFDGDPARLARAIGHERYAVHFCKSALWREIQETDEVTGWTRQVAEGALMRLEIPIIEKEDDVVLYTDADVIFTGAVRLKEKPAFIAAAPGHNPLIWEDICSGVMLLNIRNLRGQYDAYLACARENLGKPHFYDQEVLNAFFTGRFDRLDLEYHWKTYWGSNPFARIVHFHGPKRSQIAALLASNRGADRLAEIFKILHMQEAGLRHYAALFDLFKDETIKNPWALAAFNRAEYGRFGANALRGWLRRRSAGAPPVDFDEAFYRYTNHDVAIALHHGWIPSGWWHFDRVGRSEGRIGHPREAASRLPGS
jgi:hypothetical protein